MTCRNCQRFTFLKGNMINLLSTLVRQENFAEEADCLPWLGIGGASSLNLATGNPALDYFSLRVRVCTSRGLYVGVVLRLLSNTIYELVSNPKHPVLTL